MAIPGNRGTDQATEYLALEQADHPVAVPGRTSPTMSSRAAEWNDYAGARATVSTAAATQWSRNGREAARAAVACRQGMKALATVSGTAPGGSPRTAIPLPQLLKQRIRKTGDRVHGGGVITNRAGLQNPPPTNAVLVRRSVSNCFMIG